MQQKKGGTPEAEFPPQIRALGIPPKVRGVRGSAQINVNNLGGGVHGCFPDHYILHCEGT